MKKKRLTVLIICLTFSLFLIGCSREEISDEYIIEEGKVILVPSNQKKEYEKITLEDLKEKLSGAIGVELKNTENQAIGLIQDREDILEFVEKLYEYPQQEEYPKDSNENTVVGPINFYFNDDEDLFGIVKNDYVYIEGYFFLLSRNEVDKIERLFSIKVIEAPISGN